MNVTKGDYVRAGLIGLLIGAVAGLLLSGCGQGATGDVGAQGVSGASIVGPVGPQGQAGVNGTSVTVVKFCPGTTTYPSKFVEIGFCIGGKLYGTYSANDGFSTELPPGYYGSKGINSSCNFTVGANCTISN